MDVDRQPGQARHDQGRPRPEQVVVPKWMFYEQEAVHAQPNHEEDGGVKVHVQDVAVDHAGIRTGFLLVICVQVGEARQRAQEDEVRHCQVHEVNVEALPLWQTEHVAQHDYQITKETDAELQTV